MVLNAQNFKHYVDRFNADDVEDVVNKIREMAFAGDIPGITKASW